MEDECCANKNETSFEAYTNYHKFITTKFEKEFMESGLRYKQGLLIDIHGQSHSESWIELGYLISSAELSSSSNLTDYFRTSSINSLASKSSFSFDDLIRGSVSLGGILYSKYNYKVVPSPQHLSPNGGNYYSGGFITREYSLSSRKTRINAIQIESPYALRVDTQIENYALNVAQSIYDFYILHGLDQ